MVTAPAKSSSRTSSYSSVHNRAHIRQALPAEAMLLGLLKTVETRLQERRLIGNLAPQSCNPLWFLAETERNIFLWRRGCSIVQQDEFEFWVDPFLLINKRARQLARSDPENPFLNPLWGSVTSPLDGGQREVDYLEALARAFATLGGHPHALSVVGSLLAEEQGEAGTREIVLLPTTTAQMSQTVV